MPPTPEEGARSTNFIAVATPIISLVPTVAANAVQRVAKLDTFHDDPHRNKKERRAKSVATPDEVSDKALFQLIKIKQGSALTRESI